MTTEAESETEEVTTEAETETEEATEAESETEEESEAGLEDLPEFVASDYVTLGEYKGLTVTVTPVVVSDEEVEESIARSTRKTLEEGTVEDGDIVNIDYVGKLDGEEFDGGSATGYDLEIGSYTFIDGFEDGLIGVEVGETVDLELTFPESYHNEDLAGKDVVFTVTVNSLQRVQELTDEVAAEVADGMTAEEYKASVREELEESAEEDMKYEAQYELVTQVVENATVNGYPEEALSYNVGRVKDYYETIAEMSGTTLGEMLEYYGMTEEEFMGTVEETASEGLSQMLVLTAVAEAEDLTVSEEEFEEGAARYAELQGYDSTQELVEAYGENYIRNSLMQEKALDFLYENAEIVEESETEAAEEAAEEATEEETEAASEEETEEVLETEEETEEESETETEKETETESEAETEAES